MSVQLKSSLRRRTENTSYNIYELDKFKSTLIVYVLFETRWHLLSELCNRGDTILYHGGLQTREALEKDGR